ncbi:MAG: RagB/SusD family nutrient uptake outer membrane protein [Bacteroidetes bacterium]|uniref:RagB/SusD family nutrient uptake outer membrane protein n=1 Tax=Candidatus Cryptobacteroides faecavium TaxID=2840762 RepID=A0A9D9IFB7_9BACT|nr:RagB/SusD family nutrient uptake outer membrane protein [Candidatus Cryptobacteroides faecavium]
MKKKFIIISALAAMSLSSCVDMDRTPQNIWTDDNLLSNEAGVEVYMARLYSQMPWEDFKYLAGWGFNRNAWLGSLGVDGSGEAVNGNGADINRSFVGENTTWWDFTLIREANHLIETLPDYAANFDEATVNDYIGNAYFVRAYSLYQMARRFGGVPLPLKEAEYPASNDELEIPRSTEEETWDQICRDFDTAASLMRASSVIPGTANKYVALAFKAEAMNYAGCVAKYNEVVAQTGAEMTGFGSKTKVRVMGFDPATAQTASNRYFAEAYKAASEVINSNLFALQQPSANTPEAKYQNLVDLWRNTTCSENMLIREYSYPTLTHGLDAYSSPYQWRHPLSANTCPTLDLIELYDWPENFSGEYSSYGSRRYDNGHLRVTTGTDCSNGTYLEFNDVYDFFADAEPRLRAYVLFPGDSFREEDHLSVYAGIYTGSEPIEPLFDNYNYSGATDNYTSIGNLVTTSNPETNPITVELPDGTEMSAAGLNGPFHEGGGAGGTLTGLYLRKYLDPDVALEDIGEGMSDQPFILMRYADVLLAAAEAAVELSIAGEPCPVEGEDMLQVATDAIRAIQDRAGANVIDHKLAGTNEDRDIVRKERRKELAFEHKSKWDIRRWRVIHKENREGFWGEQRVNDFSNENNFRFRGIYPFYSAESGSWFFDTHFETIGDKEFGYNTVDYYFEIPSGEVSKSEYIDQQPTRD